MKTLTFAPTQQSLYLAEKYGYDEWMVNRFLHYVPNAKDMMERGYFSHFSPEGNDVASRLNEAGVDYLVVGENLAYAPSVNLAHQGLMNSPGHRANILSADFGKVGIGVIDGGIYSKMFTQVFTD